MTEQTNLPFPDENDKDYKKGLKELATLCEKAERHDDMCVYLNKLVVTCEGRLSQEQRNFLSVAFKNVVGKLRSSWRNLDEQIKSFGKESDKDNSQKQMCERYRELIAKEVKNKCNTVITILEDKENGVKIPDTSKATTKDDVEEAVFYLKMKGDYYRYMAEVDPTFRTVTVPQVGYGTKAVNAYKAASEAAKKALPETHPTRLGLALNRSVCWYEIEKNPEKACSIAKEAFDQAIQKLDTLNDDTYKDSTLIMQLLRDNLTLWQSEKEKNQVED